MFSVKIFVCTYILNVPIVSTCVLKTVTHIPVTCRWTASQCSSGTFSDILCWNLLCTINVSVCSPVYFSRLVVHQSCAKQNCACLINLPEEILKSFQDTEHLSTCDASSWTDQCNVRNREKKSLRLSRCFQNKIPLPTAWCYWCAYSFCSHHLKTFQCVTGKLGLERSVFVVCVLLHLSLLEIFYVWKKTFTPFNINSAAFPFGFSRCGASWTLSVSAARRRSRRWNVSESRRRLCDATSTSRRSSTNWPRTNWKPKPRNCARHSKWKNPGQTTTTRKFHILSLDLGAEILKILQEISFFGQIPVFTNCATFVFFSCRALQRERQLNAQLRETLDEERNSQSEFSAREKAAIADMQVRARGKFCSFTRSVQDTSPCDFNEAQKEKKPTSFGSQAKVQFSHRKYWNWKGARWLSWTTVWSGKDKVWCTESRRLRRRGTVSVNKWKKREPRPGNWRTTTKCFWSVPAETEFA